ncbi:MAG: hypothetical protein PHU46_02165 [Rhodocyclaceae bacterium]|nr:hypothetical protein [Rhodocyclaceae bacterium]
MSASEPPAKAAPQKVAAMSPINDYNITINYELGMHCTGFDFTYCCVLPPYNSIQTQVVKTSNGKRVFPELLEADPAEPGVLVDGKKRFKLAYGHVDNSYSEGSKLKYWNVPYDVNGDGKYGKDENVANAYFTHLYVYKDLKGTNPKGTSADKEKLFVGIQIPIPRDNGPAGAAVPSPMKGGHLHYTGKEGTIVFTKSPVLDNVPIVLTNPGIWDALGLPLTPFNDSRMTDPLTLTEADIQPFQEAWVSLVDAKTNAPVIDSHSGKPVRFVGTNPIDIPNCANCHSSSKANGDKFNLYKQERAFWKGLGASDWIANLKATSISILQLHDEKNGTDFLKNYNPNSRSLDNRLGRDPVLCQKCHADNVIGVLQSKSFKDPKTGKETTTSALTQAMHLVHQTKSPMPDAEGRSSACQGCHPAHRQDGKMDKYPITPEGDNAYAKGDNRDASGGCFVGRDVHANPGYKKDTKASGPHLNSIGKWMQENVSKIGNGQNGKGLWCTNCHTQLSRELYQRDNLTNAFKQEGKTIRNKSLPEIASAIGVSFDDLKARYLDPKVVLNDKKEDTPDKSGILLTWAQKRTVPDIAVIALQGNGPMVTKDEDGDINVKILSANPAVDVKSLKLPEGATGATAVPYDAATHGRDYWLAPGVPHCADCHAAPFVEGQGGVAFPINQPGKYSGMRYSKGHSGLSCQSCHESIHGLYPVTPTTDVTTYKQAAAYNPDGSHGPLKCSACHQTNAEGVPHIADKKKYDGKPILHNYDAAVSWMHANAKDLGGAIPPKEDKDD